MMWYLKCVWVRRYLGFLVGCLRPAVIFVRLTVPADDFPQTIFMLLFHTALQPASTLYKCWSWLCRPTVSSKHVLALDSGSME